MLLLPAMTVALANGVMQEAIYRGALLTWTARVTGPRLAPLGQAAVWPTAPVPMSAGRPSSSRS